MTDIIRDRATRLFQYLHELTQLRYPAVYNLEDYEDVLWLHEVPKAPKCSCAIWAQEPSAETTEGLLEVYKPNLQPPPPPPDLIVPWLDPSQIADSSRELPELSESIITADAQGRQGTTELRDRPEVKSAWEAYVEKEWWPWAEEIRRLKPVQEVYTRLYSIYQQQQLVGGAYEVVLGIGCLCWKAPNDRDIKRHIITAQVELKFDAERGIMSAVPAAEGAKPRLEQDMLDTQRPCADIEQEVTRLIGDAGNFLLGNDVVHRALQTWLNAFDVAATGRYEQSAERPAGSPREPVLRYAPAIVLRRRTSAGLLRMYDDIVKRLEAGGPVPAGIRSVVTTEEPTPGTGDGACPAADGEPLLFPLPANKAQKDIAQQLSNRTGVLVQGPPGTGKSHTIANLISHLLAQGKRVLVTSHGPQALVVLKNKLPREVGELCVFLLGNDVAAKHSLEKSVSAITDHYNSWNARVNADETARLEQELDSARRDETETTRRIISTRERETYCHEGLPGGYSGTAQKIAAQVSQQKETLGWVPDDVSSQAEPPVSDEEVLELLPLLRSTEDPTEADLAAPAVDVTRLPAVGEFAAAVEEERRSVERLKAHESHTHHPAYPALVKAAPPVRESLDAALSRLRGTCDTLTSNPHQWARQCTTEVLSGGAGKWRALLSSTRHELQSVQALLPDAADADVSGLAEQSLSTAKADAEALMTHLNNGHWLGFWFIRPAAVSSRKYIIDQVRVSGSQCRNAATLRILIQWLELRLSVARLEQHWRGVTDVPQSHIRGQLVAYEEYCLLLERTLEILDPVEAVRAVLRSLGTLWEPAWHLPEAVESLKAALAAAAAEIDLRKAREWFDLAKKNLLCTGADPQETELVLRLIGCVDGRDRAGYGEALAELQRLYEHRRRLRRRAELLRRLSAMAPALAESLVSTRDSDVWELRLRHFQAAWNWTRTRAWLAKLNDPSEYLLLLQELDDCRLRILEVRKRLAVAKAWHSCMSRLTEHERKHLMLWQEAIRKIGKGRSKYVEMYRNQAQESMNECRTAIPAWVMPIHRVADTVKPTPDAFDVAIIDEASQSGPECLFLQYLARQVVVVGDEEQISPDEVGISPAVVEQLRQRYLAGIEMRNAIGAGTSYFGLSGVLYRNVIRLREHFRCMPEIIRFSNDLCYANRPLIPLRQHGADRLEPPVVARWVQDGYQDGERERTTNPPEAEALVAQILKCLGDDAYAGKTMGVISLLGHSQSRSIDRLLKEKVSAVEIEKRQLLCGEPYAFQGDERDVVFLSMVSSAAKGVVVGVLAHDRYKRSFNVAVSRAKEQVWLFHSVTLNDLSATCLRYRLLQFCLGSDPGARPELTQALDVENQDLASQAHSPVRDRRDAPRPFDSWFEVDVYLELKQRGYRVLPHYEVDRKHIDLVVEGLDRRLAVECDGDKWHGPERFETDLERQRMLERCGWVFWRIRGSDFYRDREQAMQDLCERLEQMNIVPLQRESELREKRRVANSVPLAYTPAVAPSGEAERPVGTEPCHEVELAASMAPCSGAPAGFTPYRSWEVRDLPDPRTADRDDVADGLLNIVNVEGPITDARAYGLYAKGARLGRVARVVRHSLDTALGRLMRRGKVNVCREDLTPQEKERVIVPAGKPRVVVRTLGGRTLNEVPLSELGEVIRELEQKGYREETPLFRRVLELYGRAALTHTAVARLRAARRTAVADVDVSSPLLSESGQQGLKL